MDSRDPARRSELEAAITTYRVRWPNSKFTRGQSREEASPFLPVADVARSRIRATFHRVFPTSPAALHRDNEKFYGFRCPIPPNPRLSLALPASAGSSLLSSIGHRVASTCPAALRESYARDLLRFVDLFGKYLAGIVAPDFRYRERTRCTLLLSSWIEGFAEVSVLHGIS